MYNSTKFVLIHDIFIGLVGTYLSSIYYDFK